MTRIGEFVIHQKLDGEEHAAHCARRIFMDVLGANLRASEEPEIEQLRGSVGAPPNGTATATFLCGGFPAGRLEDVLLVNGTQAAAVELDDGYRHATSHSGAYVLPIALALGETKGASLKEAITAFAIGYEVASKAARALKAPKFHAMPHGIVSTLGAVAVAARLQGLTAEETEEAMGLAASLGHSAPFQAVLDGATVRNLWIGIGSRDALTAVTAVKAGFTAPFAGIAGAYNMIAPFDPDEFEESLGVDWAVTQNYHKQFACNGNFDAPLLCALKVREREQFSLDAVEQVIVHTYAPYHTLDVPDPRTTLQAKFSLSYAVAAALVLGEAGHEAFTAPAREDERVLAMARRVELVDDDSLKAGLPLVRPGKVDVLLTNGTRLEESIDDPPGHYQNPFSDEFLVDKFEHLLSRYVDPERASQAASLIMESPLSASVRDLVGVLRAGAIAPGDRTGVSA